MTRLIHVLLCIALLAFPFSVALTNIGLAGALGLGVVSGMWWRGIVRCWHDFRPLSVAFIAYLALVLLGLLWSSNIDWGLHIIGRHWFWLLLPILVMALSGDKWRRYFLIALSVGLTLNLLYCVLQLLGYISLVGIGGSGGDNATGHIGHIGFGVVYGIWAAWLLFMGLRSTDKKLIWLYWGLSCWSYVMIFAAQGRSAYAIAFVLAMSVIIKWYAERIGWKRITLIIAVVFVLLSTVLIFGPAKERLQGTWAAITGAQQDETASFWQKNGKYALTQRLDMWQTTLAIYRLNPIFGVGTGGLPDAVLAMNVEHQSTFNFAHPHNQYLLALVRWGPMGVIVLLMLLFYWMREGWQRDWKTSATAPLIFLPPLALAIHGLSSAAVEEHFSAILAALLLGMALSEKKSVKILRQ